MRKLYRHTKGEHQVAGGVFAGLGEWLEISPGILRVGYITIAILSGILPGILLYLAAMLMMKKNPDHEVLDI
jgi:phage shock protein PspC (stress-responsive transcriptional regulator)